MQTYVGKVVLLLLITVTCFMSGQPNKATGPYEKHAQTEKQSHEPVLGLTSHENLDQKANEHSTEADDDPFQWHTAVKRPEWWLVIGAFFTLGFLIWQTIETHRAVKATRDSIRLQEAAFYQWVNLVNWESSTGARNGVGTLSVKVDIANETGVPLTLSDVLIEIGGHKYLVSQNAFLSPKTPHTVDIEMDITTQQELDFAGNNLTLPVRGHVMYSGILKQTLTQPVSGDLSCGTGGTTFAPKVPMGPQRSRENDNG